MAAKEIRLKLRIDSDGLKIDPAKAEAAGAAAGASFAKGFAKTAADGTKVIDRGSPAGPRFARAADGTITPNRGATVAATGQTAVADYLKRGGFRPVSDRLTIDADGTKSATRYRNAAGGIATLNNETQKLSVSVPRAQTYWERFKRSLSTGSGGVSALGFFGDLAAKAYVIQAAFAGIDRLAVAPIKRLADQFIEATEASRKFELAIGGVTGLSRARQLNYALTAASRTQPTDVAGLRQTGSTFAALPALAGKLNDKDAIAQIIGLNRTVARLGTLDPEQGQQGATTAIRELLEGGGGEAFNSLRRRFGLSASTLSKAIGRTVDDIKADPGLALKATQKIVDTLIPDSVVDQSGQLFSVKVQKIRDALDQALVRVGDAGAFDHLVHKVDGVAQQLFAAIDSAKFAQQARKISDAVSRAMDSIGSSVDRFLRSVTGAGANQPLLEVVGDALASGVDRLAKIIDNVPAIADKIGQGVGLVAGEITRLVDALVDIADATRNPGKVAGRLGDYAWRRAGAYAFGADIGGMSDAAGDTLGRLDSALFGKDDAAPAVVKALPPATQPIDPRRWGEFSDLLARLDSRDDGIPNWGATLLAGNASAGRLNDLARDPADRLTEISGAGRGAFAANSDVVGRLQRQFFDAINSFDSALSEGERRLRATTDPAEANQLRGLIESTNAVRAKLTASFNVASAAVADSLTESARDFRRGLASELADLPLGGPAALAAASGRNAKIDDAMKRLETIGVQGGPTEIGSWSVFQQQAFASRVSERGLSDLQAQARTGSVAVGMTPAQINAAAAVRPDDRVIQQKQADLIQGQLVPRQAGILNAANAALAARPDDPLAIADAARAVDAYAKLAAQLSDLRDGLDGLTPAFREFAASVRDSVEHGLGDILFNLTTGANSLRETFHELAQSILREFTELAAKKLVQSVIGSAGQPQQSGQTANWGGVVGAILGGIFGGGAGATAGAGAGNAIAAANGAILPGHFQAFAAGGIARRPTLGLIGERPDGVPEAVVPMLGRGGRIPLLMDRRGGVSARLPGGRSIAAVIENHTKAYANGGVMGMGSIWAGRSPSHVPTDGPVYSPEQRTFDGAGAGQSIYVVNDAQEAVRAGFVKHRDVLISSIAGDIMRGGRVAKANRGMR